MSSVFRISRLPAWMLVVALVATSCSGSGTESDEVAPTDDSPSTQSTSVDADAQERTDAVDGGSVEAEPDEDESASYAGTEAAPEFPSGLDWINSDRELTLAELQGKAVLLDFWTYGCINCIHVIPDLKRLEEEFADELVVIGVHSAKFTNESATENIRQVVLRYDVEHPVVNDSDFEIWQTWGVNAWPTTVLIDPAGNIVGGHSGEGVYDVVAPVLRSLVDEFDASGQIDRTTLELALEETGQPSRILSFPGKVEAAPGDDRLFIADTGHHRIVMTDRSGQVLGVFGNGIPGFIDGAALTAQFDSPQGVTLSSDRTTLYVADTNNHAIRAVDTSTGAVSTVLGTGRIEWPPIGGFAPGVGLNSPWDVFIRDDLVYIAMAGHHQIWVFDLENQLAQPLVGNAREGVLNGSLDQAELAQPSGLHLSADGVLYFADSESSSIRFADLGSGLTGVLAGSDANLFDFGDTDGVGTDARFQHPLGVAIWAADRSLIVADTYNSRLRRIDLDSGDTTTLLGGEQGWSDGTDPQFYEPGGIVIDGDTLYVADTNNHAIRIVDLATLATSTLLIKGIEAFEPPPDSEAYRGVVTSLAPVAVADGTATVQLDVALPDGYKVNEAAPSSLTLGGPGLDNTVDLTGTEFPVDVALAVDGEGDLVADLNLVYCRDDQESLCLFEQVRFVVPLVDGAPESASLIELSHAIELPAVTG